MRIRHQAVIACFTVLCAAGAIPALRGDDLVLTDGKKISGTIVGMENGSFRVETDFGIAFVRKDRVARIDLSKTDLSKTDLSKADLPKPAATAERPAPTVAAAAKPARPPAASRPPAIQERKPPGGKIEEHVEGATYFNDSFGFQMFKPPNWKVLDETARDIPSAVAALGTEDETTLIIVGTVRFEGPPSAYANVLGSSMKKIYSDYEVKPEEQLAVAGFTAIRHSFSGMANGREWHGMVVNLADGAIHYGIIGITSDLNYQFKSSVLSKMITSFRFR